MDGIMNQVLHWWSMQSRGWTFFRGQHVRECCSLVAYIPRWRGEAWQRVLVYCIQILPSPSDEASMKAWVCSMQSLFKLWCHMIEFLMFEFHRHSFTSPTMTTQSPPLLLSFLLVVSCIPGGSCSCMANSNDHDRGSSSLRRGHDKTTLTKPCGIDLHKICAYMHCIKGPRPLFDCLFQLACRLCHLDCQRGVISCCRTPCIEFYLVQSTVSTYIYILY